MVLEKEATNFDVFAGVKNGDELSNPIPVGIAKNRVGELFYILNIKKIVAGKLYLVKNTDSQNEYTVFAGYNRLCPGQPFRLPCGTGYLDPGFQSYLEIRLEALNYPLFMSLFSMKEAA